MEDVCPPLYLDVVVVTTRRIRRSRYAEKWIHHNIGPLPTFFLFLWKGTDSTPSGFTFTTHVKVMIASDNLPLFRKGPLDIFFYGRSQSELKDCKGKWKWARYTSWSTFETVWGWWDDTDSQWPSDLYGNVSTPYLNRLGPESSCDTPKEVKKGRGTETVQKKTTKTKIKRENLREGREGSRSLCGSRRGYRGGEVAIHRWTNKRTSTDDSPVNKSKIKIKPFFFVSTVSNIHRPDLVC